MSTLDSSAFASIAAELQAEPDEGVTARAIVDRLTGLVPDATWASLTIRVRGGHHTLASSDERADAADALQYSSRQGPCIEAADGSTWLRSGNVRDDPRWPSWGPQAWALGVRSSLSVQLLDGDRLQGALNLYGDTTGRFADHDVVDLALIYAIHAANALTSARLATNLQTALSSRHSIGMAQGIVMERFGLDEHQSFELLRRLSSTGEAKLRDVAAQIVETRTLPDPVATQAT